MPHDFQFAICNEVFGSMSFDETCKQISAIGYAGLEIAPFTLSTDPGSLDAAARSQVSEALKRHSLSFVGLHWLLAVPEGLHATTRDESVRTRTWSYVHQLIDLCGDLASGNDGRRPVMIFGSPKQRSSRDGMSPKEATDVFMHELAHAAPHAESRGVTILIEALPKNQSDIINSLGEAVCMVKQIGSPAVQTMFDVHNAVDEAEPHTELIRKYAPYVRHVHVNEPDGREPGIGDYDFIPLFNTLSDIHYRGWVSVEAFDFSRNPVEIARRAITRLQGCARMEMGAKANL